MGSRQPGKPSAAAARQAGHPWPAWFQDSVQHAQLLTNRTLREYLLAHSADRWPEVAKATLLYGVLCLRRDFPGQPALPLETLHEAARQLHTQAALGAALPDIRARFDSLEAELGGCLAELGDAAAGGGPAQDADDLPTAAFLLVQPRVSTAGGPGGIKGDTATSQAAPRARPPAAAQSRIKLQHAQRLALRRQESEGQEERPANWGQPPGHTGACAPMCRFAVRGGPAGAPPAAEPVHKLEQALDLDSIFEHGIDDLDTNDLALLALFSGNAPSGNDASAGSSRALPSPHDASPNTVVLGQALTAPAPAALAVPLAVPAHAANPVQQLQFQAVMQHQAAIMQNPTAYPAAAQMYQQAMLVQQQQQAVAQQQLLAAQSGSLLSMPLPAAVAPQPLVGKRGKTAEEVEEQTERIKKRRRESAQRSRQRKNAYMKSLEMENRALKMENERLRVELNKCAGGAAAALAVPVAPKASSSSVSRHDCTGDCSQDEHVSMSDDDEELCDPPMMHAGVGGLPGSAAADMHADPLALMPTAELLSFAF
ncbi:ABSCISIC ACID-INSENSITIVE 5 2 isoform X1 [Micractinium conductrix]|uniref:ABSCISIC ACID-INSENSITIVE 5 2 isoform X1 n=1 Tax=Micractinium conductrix TaxID=554055 RepID=A0A2P6VM34_9CHLO|nr:ABSCISIC ACID-INSENSITIVE 5 2 isoform X1 [Micractinium conductrix]|eukprot:PSC75154.1 ABSCISIC ACID-INSENSITIVE 5 2 isoform X1 [Micractinium conductrix]